MRHMTVRDDHEAHEQPYAETIQRARKQRPFFEVCWQIPVKQKEDNRPGHCNAVMEQQSKPGHDRVARKGILTENTAGHKGEYTGKVFPRLNKVLGTGRQDIKGAGKQACQENSTDQRDWL